jgi:hypothetical protein
MCSIKKQNTLKIKNSGKELPWVLVFTSVVILGINFKTLAYQVPIFFNWPSKDFQGMATKDVLWGVPVVFSIVLYVFSVIINKLKEIKELKTKPNNPSTVYLKQTVQMLKSLKLLFGFVCLFLVCASLDNSSEIQKTKHFIGYQLVPLLCIGIPFYYLIKGVVISERQGNLFK